MGLHLFFLPNFPGATFIPDSRVSENSKHDLNHDLNFYCTHNQLHVPQ